MSTRLTLTPLRCHNPRKNRGIPTISAGRPDGGAANVSSVDTELLRCSTPRGLARSWCHRAPSTQVLSHVSVSRRSVYPAYARLTHCGSPGCRTVTASTGSERRRGLKMDQASSIPALLVRVHLSGRNTMTETGRRHRPSTPACAGLTSCPLGQCRRGPLYPRLRGADLAAGKRLGLYHPLPPHTRG